MRTTFIIVIIILTLITVYITAYAQKEGYTLLLLDFENKSGIQNPLLAKFNDAISFGLSRQPGPTQVRLIPTSYRDAFLARARLMKPNSNPIELGLLAAESADADALVVGSYTKQGEQWSLEAQVYHRREGRRAIQEIQIQGDSVYKLLDDFPTQLFQQFTDVSYVALTTSSWRAYEEFRKGHEAFDNYKFLGALVYYDKALKLDPTLALVYAEQSYAYFVTGQLELATKAIKAAQQLLSKASPMEQLAILALAYSWDAKKNAYRNWEWGIINLASGGVWDEALIHMILAAAYKEEGKHAEADQHNQLWFKAMQQRIQAYPDDASLLHQTASHCLNIGRYLDEAISMELKAVELNLKESIFGPRYILSRLYELKGDIEQALEWAKRSVQQLPDPRLDEEFYAFSYDQVWYYLATWLHEKKIPPKRLLGWCEDVLRIPGLHQPYRLRTQYLIADIYNVMKDKSKVNSMLTSLGVPRESDWMVIGPFDTSEENLFPETLPFELLTNLAERHRGILGKEVQWKSWKDDNPLDGRLSIFGVFNRKYYGGPLYGPFFPPLSIVYSCIYVEVPKTVKAQVRTGSGLMKIWLNDELSPVIEVDSSQEIPDNDLNSISLKAGFNRFLVATVSKNFNFFFRITDAIGKPIPGLKFFSVKEVTK